MLAISIASSGNLKELGYLLYMPRSPGMGYGPHSSAHPHKYIYGSWRSIPGRAPNQGELNTKPAALHLLISGSPNCKVHPIRKHIELQPRQDARYPASAELSIVPLRTSLSASAHVHHPFTGRIFSYETNANLSSSTLFFRSDLVTASLFVCLLFVACCCSQALLV